MYWPMSRGRGHGCCCRGCCLLRVVVSIVFCVCLSIVVVAYMSSKRWGRKVVQTIDQWEHQMGLGIIQNTGRLGLFHGSLIAVVVVVFIFVIIVSVIVNVVKRLNRCRGRRHRSIIGCVWGRMGPLTTVDVPCKSNGCDVTTQ